MKSEKRLYMASYGLALILAVFAEVMWLGDPLRWGHYYWIDQLEWLSKLLALVPLIWAAAAVCGYFLDRKASRLHKLLRLLIVIGSAGTIASLLRNMEQVEQVAGWALSSLALTIAALFIIERRMHRTGRRSIILFTALVLVSALLFWPTPYAVTSPGFTLNMNRYAQVEGGQAKGSIEGVLIIDRPAFPIDWLYAALWPQLEIYKRDTSVSLGQIQQIAHIQRADANQISSAIALQQAGIGRGVMPTGIHVLRIVSGSHAEGKLQAGDRIIAVNGQTTASVEQLYDVMGGIEPGSNTIVTLVRNKDEIEVEIETQAAADDANRSAFGIEVENSVQADLPRLVQYRPYLVYQGGPSHGAILALTLLDQLLPEGVTYGNEVAGTGTLNAAGDVGPIGGIAQKAYAVERSGADVFFVPSGQEEEARKWAKKLNIVPVQHLQDMLDWLKQHPK
ncbi:S16 family serine protease [Paenibacillus sp. GCM10027626]|uniref:S16 family serine protease n=1 Tax=Paenibacillus sp. GCM10027626 TaxID=3273411 RepID=UPI0036291240